LTRTACRVPSRSPSGSGFSSAATPRRSRRPPQRLVYALRRPFADAAVPIRCSVGASCHLCSNPDPGARSSPCRDVSSCELHPVPRYGTAPPGRTGRGDTTAASSSGDPRRSRAAPLALPCVASSAGNQSRRSFLPSGRGRRGGGPAKGEQGGSEGDAQQQQAQQGQDRGGPAQVQGGQPRGGLRQADRH
jgi:hypothetical protein